LIAWSVASAPQSAPMVYYPPPQIILPPYGTYPPYSTSVSTSPQPSSSKSDEVENNMTTQVTDSPLLSQTEGMDASHQQGKTTGRKTRWRPTQEQKQTLEKIWSQNQYPDQPTKQNIAKSFIGVTYKQITSWFKHKRENDKHKGMFQYKFPPAMKFTSEQLTILEDTFQHEPYAKGKTLIEVAARLDVSLKRIQNWFKHKRSRLAQQGKFEYKPRNLLNTDQITFLRGAFAVNTSPTQEICEQLGTDLNVKPEQVSRWFSNERSRKRKREEQMKAGLGDSVDESPPYDAPEEEELSKSIDVSKIKRGRKLKSTTNKLTHSNLIPLVQDTELGHEQNK